MPVMVIASDSLLPTKTIYSAALHLGPGCSLVEDKQAVCMLYGEE